MSFGTNLRFLRKMHNGMTQEVLAEKLDVSRQTISKWEMDAALPEMETAFALCDLFSCSLDELLRGNIDSDSDLYTRIHIETVSHMKYYKYAVISEEPEDDAIKHTKAWAASCGIENAEIIGWDFPFLSQEQINVFHMHGYAAACILPPNFGTENKETTICEQSENKYAVITIKEPFTAPFTLIPNAYKTLMRYMNVNDIKHKESKDTIPCFEKEYEKDGVTYMDVYIAVK